MKTKKDSLKIGIGREKQELPFIEPLLEIILGPTQVGKAGFPILAEKSYLLFLEKIPHIFLQGNILLEVLEDLSVVNKNTDALTPEEKESAQRAIDVLRRVTSTAAVTSPSDLWLLKQVFSSLKEVGASDSILKENYFSSSGLAKSSGLDESYLSFDLSFLHSRGYLSKTGEKFKLANNACAKQAFNHFGKIEEDIPRNMVPLIVDYLVGGKEHVELVEWFYSYSLKDECSLNWVASVNDIELGYRLLPLVLACRSLDLHGSLKKETPLNSVAIKLSKDMRRLLEDTGAVGENNKITALGERMFSRGPGPYGIIHAYYSYLANHSNLLQGKDEEIWVARGENVAASQDANGKTFQQINNALDSFCEKFSFSYSVYIEHAVGQGESTRQRFEKSGEKSISYFGADLEDSAIDKAIENQGKGELPKNMQFVRNADIGKPQILVEGVKKAGASLEGSIMVVGNGFHEVRDQNNEKMIEVFKGYADAGILLAFTEESGLTDEDLIYTGWNTYHAGFRFVHDISGQGLRPAIDKEDDPNSRYSWKKCASLAGYEVVEEFTTRTRTVYPHPRKDGYNPSISVNYFCVPKKLWQKLTK